MLIVCRSCDTRMKVPDGAAGRTGRCPRCGAAFIVPAAPAAVAGPTTRDEGITASAPPVDYSAPPRPPRRPSEPEPEEPPPPRRPRRADADDDWDNVRPRRRQDHESVGLSVASMVLGIVSAVTSTLGSPCCCGLLGTPLPILCGGIAVVMGLAGMAQGGRAYAYTGMGLGAAGLVIALGWILLGIGVIALTQGG
jgi:hypothetical protein